MWSNIQGHGCPSLKPNYTSFAFHWVNKDRYLLKALLRPFSFPIRANNFQYFRKHYLIIVIKHMRNVLKKMAIFTKKTTTNQRLSFLLIHRRVDGGQTTVAKHKLFTFPKVLGKPNRPPPPPFYFPLSPVSSALPSLLHSTAEYSNVFAWGGLAQMRYTHLDGCPGNSPECE